MKLLGYWCLFSLFSVGAFAVNCNFKVSDDNSPFIVSRAPFEEKAPVLTFYFGSNLKEAALALKKAVDAGQCKVASSKRYCVMTMGGHFGSVIRVKLADSRTSYGGDVLYASSLDRFKGLSTFDLLDAITYLRQAGYCK